MVLWDASGVVCSSYGDRKSHHWDLGVCVMSVIVVTDRNHSFCCLNYALLA